MLLTLLLDNFLVQTQMLLDEHARDGGHLQSCQIPRVDLNYRVCPPPDFRLSNPLSRLVYRAKNVPRKLIDSLFKALIRVNHQSDLLLIIEL